MLRYISLKDQLLKERRINEQLNADLKKKTADIDYIAMMCDIELEVNEEDQYEA